MSDSPGFLLAQVGAHANLRFADRLRPSGFTPAMAGTLWAIAADEGLSQRTLALRLGSHPSRIVALLDDLEARGWVERKSSEADRRLHAIRLTGSGRDQVRWLNRVAREHQAALLAALDEDERAELATLLWRIAEAEGLSPGVHPGFRAP